MKPHPFLSLSCDNLLVHIQQLKMTTVFLPLPEIPEENLHSPYIYHASTPGRAEAIYFLYGAGMFFPHRYSKEMKLNNLLYCICIFIVYVPFIPVLVDSFSLFRTSLTGNLAQI